MNLQKEAMSFGLKALNRFASLEVMNRPELRKPLSRAMFEASRAGFSAVSLVNRPFKAVQKLVEPLRPSQSSVSDLFDLTPSDEQQMLIEATRQFAAELLRPYAESANEACATPADTLRAAQELGVAALNIPEALGGVASEKPAMNNVLIAECLAHGDVGQALMILSAPSVANALATYGTADQQAQYLPSFCGNNPPHAALAVMEGGALFNPMQPKTTAKRDGSAYVLNGEKTLVVGAASAELFLISAQLDGGKPSLFVVEAGVVGLSVSPQPAMGLRAAALARVHLQNIRLPLSARMDDKLDFAEFLAASRLAWCALAVGAGQAALDYVIPYCNDRKAFGEPISHRQAVAFMVANIGIEVEGMRLATRRAAARAAAGKSFVREAALARSLCGRHGMKIGSDAVQLLGGHGFTHEYPVERFYRDLRAMAVLEGAILV